MSDLWDRIKEKNTLDAALREEIEVVFGARGKKALSAIDAGKVKKYLDFFVVEGRTAEYVVDEDFCTCRDFLYRGRTCWHLLAVRIAIGANLARPVDEWYQDRWKIKGDKSQAEILPAWDNPAQNDTALPTVCEPSRDYSAGPVLFRRDIL
ncbi:MAG: SWIM zinc finger family protein [Methanomicrobiales archaeon]